MAFEKASLVRKTEFPVDSIITDRWSPRAMSGAKVTKEELFPLFEAARWAQSASNEQPWRFFYAYKGTAHWDTFFNLLVEFNQGWVKNAGAIILVASRVTSTHNGKPFPTGPFDTGAAAQLLSLQGSRMGLVVHGMAGFDYERARIALNIPPELKVEAMFAVGHPGEKDALPPALKEREVPSQRRPLSDLVTEGPFKA